MNFTDIGRPKLLWLPLVLCASMSLSGCMSAAQERTHEAPAPASTAVVDVGDQELVAAQARQARRVMVTAEARVYKLLPDDTKGIPHQRFLLRLSNGSTVLVAHNTRIGPRVPVAPGDLIRLHGEFIWNDKGGVLHWTHHSPEGRHEGGWIDYRGQRYQ